MKKNCNTSESEIKQRLEESKAENDALKKLIEALREEEIRMKNEKKDLADHEHLKPDDPKQTRIKD